MADADRWALALDEPGEPRLFWTGRVLDAPEGGRRLELTALPAEAVRFPDRADAVVTRESWSEAFPNHQPPLGKLVPVELTEAQAAPAEQPGAAGATVHKGAVAAPNLGGWWP